MVGLVPSMGCGRTAIFSGDSVLSLGCDIDEGTCLWVFGGEVEMGGTGRTAGLGSLVRLRRDKELIE